MTRERCDRCNILCRWVWERTIFNSYLLCENCTYVFRSTRDHSLWGKCINNNSFELADKVFEDWIFGAGLDRPIHVGRHRGKYRMYNGRFF